MSGTLPIFDGDQLTDYAGFRVFSVMMYPKDARSAENLYRILVSEHEASLLAATYSESELFKTVWKSSNYPLMVTVGEMALRMAKNHLDGLAPSKSLAAHMVAENNRQVRLENGKKRPSDTKRLRKTFNEFLPVAHLWGSLCILRNDLRGNAISGEAAIPAVMLERETLIEVLVQSLIIEDLLQACLPDFVPISASAKIVALADPEKSYAIRALGNTDASIEAVRTYVSRSGI